MPDITLRATAVPSGNPTGNFTITVPATVEADDILLVGAGGAGNGLSISVTDDEGAGSWAEKANQEDISGGLCQGALFWKRASANTAGATITVTITGGGGVGTGGHLSVYLGCHNSGDPIEAVAAGDPNPASITTLTDGAMVCLESFNGDSLTGPSAQSTATSPGALTEHVEKITSVLSVDFCSAHASALKSSAGATGAFSHSNADVGIGYALKPLQVPIITDQPDDTRVFEGNTAQFSLSATDPLSGSLTYQWQRDTGSGFSNIGGATSNSFTTETLDSADDGDLFRCNVTNAVGTTTSAAVRLGVDHNPTTNPAVFDHHLLAKAWF